MSYCVRPAVIAALVVCGVTAQTASGQTTYTWSGGGNGGGSSYRQGSNWVGGNAAGSSLFTTNTDIAQFGAAGTSTPIGFNFGSLGGTYYLGTLQLAPT